MSIEDRDKLMKKYEDRFLYEEKADIHGCCIELRTDLKSVKELWEDNFYPMSEHIQSHGRLIVTKEENDRLRVLYDRLSKTVFLINVDYYGWIKSIALSTAGDILEDNQGIFSVHGACVDLEGRGICLIAPSGTGKTTHTYGLLTLKGNHVISDDWFFVRLSNGDVTVFGSEKNFYIRADIAEIWGQYKKLVEKAEFDSKGRAVVNIRWIVGKEKIIPMATLKTAILLKRDPKDKTVLKKLSSSEAVQYMESVDFCNPHLLVKDARKSNLRKHFFRKFFRNLETYSINTTVPVIEAHKMIKEAIGKD